MIRYLHTVHTPIGPIISIQLFQFMQDVTECDAHRYRGMTSPCRGGEPYARKFTFFLKKTTYSTIESIRMHAPCSRCGYGVSANLIGKLSELRESTHAVVLTVLHTHPRKHSLQLPVLIFNFILILAICKTSQADRGLYQPCVVQANCLKPYRCTTIFGIQGRHIGLQCLRLFPVYVECLVY